MSTRLRLSPLYRLRMRLFGSSKRRPTSRQATLQGHTLHIQALEERRLLSLTTPAPFEVDRLASDSPVETTVAGSTDFVPFIGGSSGLATPGSDIFVSWSVSNFGDTPPNAPTWRDRICFSLDANYDNGDLLLFQTDVEAAAIASGFYGQSANIVLPAEITQSGFLIVVTDALDVVQESDESNNVATANLAIADFDLAITGSVVPDSFATGDSVQFNWTVTNVGSETIPSGGFWSDNLYLSDDNQLDATDEILNVVPHFVGPPLEPSAFYNDSITIPLQRGAAFVLFETNGTSGGFPAAGELNHANNVAAVPIHVSGPDLAIESFAMQAVVSQGGAYNVSWNARNVGNEAVTSYWQIYATLSVNDVLGDDDDRFLYSSYITNNLPLNPGASFDRTDSVVVRYSGQTSPSTIPIGHYHLFVRANYADDANVFNIYHQLVEVEPYVADLLVHNVMAPSSALLGSNALLSYDVTNVGLWYTSVSPLEHAVFYSDDDVWDTTDFQLTFERHYNYLAAGETISFSTGGTLRHGAPGRHYLIFVGPAEK